ncbi:kinectin isoform X1 [Coregonus clupeaformis]|uniref:kinectin isoform X1 n=1 Tax=Coregonus clupeaformis TaxID=59861 RepID=UPI001BE02E71|nr:kinectin isoform X1 [Coregonus clupeaformis]XP_041703630.1 kinectin isoform X1 [Coregonus clupeaformis]
MALDIYDSQYLVILAPSLVIALIFLFFWLFMKETSYDEVLARQKRDLKLPPSKPDTRKKNDKKKSKKKESSSGGGGGGGGGGESEEDLRDFDVADAVSSSTAEEEEPTPVAPPTPVPAPVATPAEAPAGLRERKKKEKKAAKAAAAPPAEEPEVNGTKQAGRKAESPAPVAKPSPPSPQPDPQPQPPCQAQTPSQPSGKKKKEKKQKTESVEEEMKVEKAPAPVKKEAPVPMETKAQDSAAPLATTTTSGKKKNSAKKQKTEHVDDVQADSAASANHNDDAPSKGSGKKQKNEANKENSELKLKELLVSLGSLALSQAEAVSVVTVLKEKNPSALDAWQKSAAKADPSSLERERLLTTLQEEASIAKDKVQQLSKELQQEKQKTVRAEAVLRDQRGAIEKELNVVQAKAQGELQGMQMKFQKLREQLEGQIARLQQENAILRDAVSSATNQMENKQSSELNQLRSEYSGLMKELAENNNKLQQEEHQRKSLEVNYKQNVSQLEAQLQDAKRGWEELQNYLHNVNAEREKLHAAKEELQSQLLAVETEMSNKNKEIQTLHSSLTDTIVSKDQVEQKVMQLLEVSQHSLAEDSVQVQDLLSEKCGLKAQIETLQAQLSSQATTVSHFEELQKLLAEKELQRKSLEDSLNTERSSGAIRENNMQAMHNENMALKADLQNQISEQTVSQLALDQFQKSVQEREEKIKTVEDLLKMGMIEVANKEEELKTVREEKNALKREMEALMLQTTEQTSSDLIVEGLQSKIQEKDEQIKSMEESLQAAQASGSSNGMTIESLEQQVAGLQADMEQLRQKQAEDTTSARDQLLELQTQLAAKDQEIQTLQSELETRAKEVSDKVQELQQRQQTHTEAPSPELLTALAEKEKQVSDLQGELAKLRESLELHRNKNNELRVKNWSAMEALAATESMLQGKLSKALKENQTALEIAQAECRDVLHRLLPNVPLPTEQNHQEWLQRFETAVREAPAAEPNPAPEAAPEPAPEGSEDTKVLAEKLKESEEAQKVLQKDCETYKKVLAETEGILQRLQSSVEKEESRWKVKLDLSQTELKEMSEKVAALEQEVDRLSDSGELDNLIKDKQHLESELEKAERESATYVTEVRELKDLLTELQSKLDGSYKEAVRQNEELNLLKTQLTETLSKLETEECERQKVAGDLYKAQQSLDLIQEELFKETGQGDLIENSNLSSHEEIDRKEKKTAGLNQTVRELQQLLQAVNRQLTKRQEAESDKDSPEA